ncbi:MAG: acireductone synthase [Blastocatellales bacterium]
MIRTLNATPIKAILLDIEGTTTPIAFVHQILFPYARERAGAYLKRRFNSEDIQADLSALRREQSDDLSRGLDPPGIKADSSDALIESAESYILWLMDRDRKSTPLKSLQGKIWEEGYRLGALKGQVFADVRPAFERWRKQGKLIYIYSSGSALAQKLLFAHTTAGDLTEFISGYFDTNIGAKIESGSYRRIAENLQLPPAEVVFVSDVTKELDAAEDAGMRTALSLRPGNQSQPNANSYLAIETFDDLF